MAKIAILGSGNVGSALQRGLSRFGGHEIRTSHRTDAKDYSAIHLCQPASYVFAGTAPLAMRRIPSGTNSSRYSM
jgi:predicted dinucleotide-binding enzyme